MVVRSATRTQLIAPMRQAVARADEWLISHSIIALRLSVGFVFLLFGVLKFVPGLSPAESLVQVTLERISFGILGGYPALLSVAVLETVVGLSLLSGRGLRIGVALLLFAMIGILSPLVVMTGELFTTNPPAPTLAAQYVIKDIVLLAAALVLLASRGGASAIASSVGMDDSKPSS